MSDVVGMPLRRLRPGENRDCHGQHSFATPSDFEIMKPTMRPPIPGPRFVYLCRNCAAELIYRLAVNVQQEVK